MILEFSHVENPILRQIYDTYSFNVIPRMGGLVANDSESYQYLVESIRRFPTQVFIDSGGLLNFRSSITFFISSCTCLFFVCHNFYLYPFINFYDLQIYLFCHFFLTFSYLNFKFHHVLYIVFPFYLIIPNEFHLQYFQLHRQFLLKLRLISNSCPSKRLNIYLSDISSLLITLTINKSIDNLFFILKQDDLLLMVKDAGFGCASYTNMSFGVVAVHTGFKL